MSYPGDGIIVMTRLFHTYCWFRVSTQGTECILLFTADLPRLPSHVPAVALLCKDVDDGPDDIPNP